MYNNRLSPDKKYHTDDCREEIAIIRFFDIFQDQSQIFSMKDTIQGKTKHQKQENTVSYDFFLIFHIRFFSIHRRNRSVFFQRITHI